jgi:hypothetical protein
MSGSVCFEPISKSALYQGTTSVVPKRGCRTRALAPAALFPSQFGFGQRSAAQPARRTLPLEQSLAPQIRRGPEGRPLNVSPARKGWVGILIMIPPAPLCPGVPWGLPWERHLWSKLVCWRGMRVIAFAIAISPAITPSFRFAADSVSRPGERPWQQSRCFRQNLNLAP